jgi:diketogulonate reductase-like aldo/keto reductase
MNTRRRFIQSAAALGAACLSGTASRISLAAPPEKDTAMTSPMMKRAIPRGGELLPVIGLGTYQSFDAGPGAAEREPLKEVLRELVRHGGNVVDSSPMYGRAESVLGEVATATGLTASLFMATKVWTSGREAGIAQMGDSLRKMQVTRMDLMQIHNLLDWRTHAKTLRDWKDQGRIRYSGITHYHEGAYDDLGKILKTREFDFVQFNYSIAEREAEDMILPLAAETGTAVIINRPFAQSSLFARVKGREVPAWAADFDCSSWAAFFLKYIISHPAVTCAIPATHNPRHMQANALAGSGRLPDGPTRKKMVDFMAGL